MKGGRGRRDTAAVCAVAPRSWLAAPSPIQMNYLRFFCVDVFMRFDAMVERSLHACQFASHKKKKILPKI